MAARTRGGPKRPRTHGCVKVGRGTRPGQADAAPLPLRRSPPHADERKQSLQRRRTDPGNLQQLLGTAKSPSPPSILNDPICKSRANAWQLPELIRRGPVEVDGTGGHGTRSCTRTCGRSGCRGRTRGLNRRPGRRTRWTRQVEHVLEPRKDCGTDSGDTYEIRRCEKGSPDLAILHDARRKRRTDARQACQLHIRGSVGIDTLTWSQRSTHALGTLHLQSRGLQKRSRNGFRREDGRDGPGLPPQAHEAGQEEDSRGYRDGSSLFARHGERNIGELRRARKCADGAIPIRRGPGAHRAALPDRPRKQAAPRRRAGTA